jgi:hypothetical protein
VGAFGAVFNVLATEFPKLLVRPYLHKLGNGGSELDRAIDTLEYLVKDPSCPLSLPVIPCGSGEVHALLQGATPISVASSMSLELMQAANGKLGLYVHERVAHDRPALLDHLKEVAGGHCFERGKCVFEAGKVR